MVQCSAINCKVRSGNGIAMFSFPKDPSRRKAWVDKVKRKAFVPTKYSKLCEKHFVTTDFKSSREFAGSIGFGLKALYLQDDAIPSVFDYGVVDPSRKRKIRSNSAVEKRQRIQIIQEALDACDKNMSKNEGINPGANTTDEESHDSPVPTPGTVTSCTETTETCCTESVGLKATVVTYNDATQTPKYLVPVRHVRLQTDRFCNKTRSRTIGTQTDVTQITREDLLNDSMTTIGSLNNSFESDCWKPSMSDDEDDGQIAVNEDDGDEDDDITPAKERKFLVFEEQLDILFERDCGNCGLRIPSLQKTVKGSGLFVSGTCKCGNMFSWSSQPTSGTMPLGNLLMASAILFSGSSPSKALSIFRHMSIQAISERTFFLIQQLYLVPTIENVFAVKQEELLSEILSREAPVRLGGDGRCCSPGHTASFGTYSIMDLATDKILDVKLVQSNEVKNSYHMELEGLQRCLTFIESQGVEVSHLITDRHSQIKKFMKENKPDITHWFDVWHVAKGYKPFDEMEKVVSQKVLINDIKKLSPAEQTSALESFHKVICQFAPKFVHYQHAQMEARMFLAVLHYNENSRRQQATNKAGEPLFSVSFPKSRGGEGIAKEIKVEQSFEYVEDLTEDLVLRREINQSYALAKSDKSPRDRPPPLAYGKEKTAKDEIVARHIQRFNC